MHLHSIVFLGIYSYLLYESTKGESIHQQKKISKLTRLLIVIIHKSIVKKTYKVAKIELNM